MNHPKFEESAGQILAPRKGLHGVGLHGGMGQVTVFLLHRRPRRTGEHSLRFGAGLPDPEGGGVPNFSIGGNFSTSGLPHVDLE